MDTRPLFILASFVFGVAATIFFVHINATNFGLLSKTSSSPFLASATGAIATSDQSAATSSITASNTTSPDDVTPPKKLEYKFLRDVDACTMNKLGAQSWQIIQFGTGIDSIYGYDENCKNGKTYDVIEWALFSREKQ